MEAFRRDATQYMGVYSDAEMSFIEADLAEGFGVSRELADLAVNHLGPHCSGMQVGLLQRGAGNTKGASLNLRFHAGPVSWSPSITAANLLARAPVNFAGIRRVKPTSKKQAGPRPAVRAFSHSRQY